jgi:hypothetical protein
MSDIMDYVIKYNSQLEKKEYDETMEKADIDRKSKPTVYSRHEVMKKRSNELRARMKAKKEELDKEKLK